MLSAADLLNLGCVWCVSIPEVISQQGDMDIESDDAMILKYMPKPILHPHPKAQFTCPLLQEGLGT